MSNIFETLDYLKKYGQALLEGIEKTSNMLPIVTKQQIMSKAKQKMNSTFDVYMNAVHSKIDGDFLVVELDESSWLANAVESGADGFSIKKGLLSSPKAKRGSKGFRYIRVPIEKDAKKAPESMGTEKSQEYQRLIQHVMRKPVFQNKTPKKLQSGEIIEQEQLVTKDPKLQGFYRFRKFKNQQEFDTKSRKGMKFQYVMFRTVSDAPSKTGATWQHPGITGVGIFKQVERELPDILETLLEENIESAMEKIK